MCAFGVGGEGGKEQVVQSWSRRGQGGWHAYSYNESTKHSTVIAPKGEQRKYTSQAKLVIRRIPFMSHVGGHLASLSRQIV